MIPAEILKKVKLIEIRTRRLVNNLFGGEYHSAFKGMGMEFAEVREYLPGDDIRNIDWNVTARTGKPHIKKYNEERELTVLMVVDVSASGYFGTGSALKSDLMVEIASILALSATRNNDKVGLLLFSDQVECFIPPKKGKSHALRVIRELIYYQAEDRRTNISGALEYLLKMLKRRSVIFLISDFIDQDFNTTLRLTNQKHDLICIQLTDPAELEMMPLGLVKLHDVEHQTAAWVDTSQAEFRATMRQAIEERHDRIRLFCRKHEIDLIPINTGRSFVEPLVAYFNQKIARQ